jgi:hypothetical protein
MSGIWLGVVSALKSILLKVLSEKFFVWLFFWASKALVENTKTPHDDEFLKKIKELHDEQSKTS